MTLGGHNVWTVLNVLMVSFYVVRHQKSSPGRLADHWKCIGRRIRDDLEIRALRLSYAPIWLGLLDSEPMADNPCLRPIKAADKKATVELPGVLEVAPPSQATDRTCTGIAGLTRTHDLRPAKRATDKG